MSIDETGPASPRHRKIIHIDMDAFYASVEQRDDPALRGRPVAVGSAAARGVVAAASYEARAFGVRSAMASVTALRRCPALVFVPPRFDVYRAVSQQIRAIFADYTDLVEPLSLDEAYLDVTADQRGIGSATAIATEIRVRIKAETGLTASAGVSYNKFVAKLASDQNKPDGLCVIRPAHGAAFVGALPVKRFHGVGPVTAAKMAALGILTGADLRACGLDELAAHFGSSAAYFHRAAHGDDDRAVTPDRPLKSVGAERTFDTDLAERDDLQMALGPVVDAAWQRIERSGALGRTVTLKVKFIDFRLISRSRTAVEPIASRMAFAAQGAALIDALLPVATPVRLLGLALSGFETGRAAAAPAHQHKVGRDTDRRRALSNLQSRRYGDGMADEPDSLILRDLRRIDERMERIEVRLDQLTNRTRVLEESMATMAHAVAAMSGRLDDVDGRLSRIERRLDLVSV